MMDQPKNPLPSPTQAGSTEESPPGPSGYCGRMPPAMARALETAESLLEEVWGWKEQGSESGEKKNLFFL